MASAVARIPKPNMAHPQKKALLRAFLEGLVLATIGTASFYFFHVKPRYEAEVEFYRTYDPYKEFHRMRNLGLFQCCPPDYILAERAAKKKK